MKIEKHLKDLTSQELIRFDKFIKSPYFNTNKDVCKLLKELLNNLNKTSENQYLEKIRKKHSWSAPQLAKLGNSLFDHFLDFLFIERTKHNNLVNNTFKFLMLESDLKKMPLKRRKLASQILSKNIESSGEMALRFLFTQAYYSEPESYEDLNKAQNLIFEQINQLQLYNELNQKLTSLYLSNTRYEYIHPKQTIDQSISIWSIQKLINVYEGLLSIEHVFNCLKLLHTFELASNSQIWFGLDYLLNYATAKLNRGDISLYHIIYELYRFSLDLNLFNITLSDYRNIPYLACKAEQYSWALDFVEKYKSNLPSDQQESAYSFTKARTLWHAKKYSEVIKTLRDVEYEDILYNLLARAYLLTCYYELDEDEALDSLIKSFKVYLRRKRNVSVKRKESFMFFINAIDHLMKARERRDIKRIMKAREIIDENPSTRNKDWLLEKIEELETSLGVKRPTADSE